MNSKTLLLLGVVGAVAMSTASAQVYSVNAVGYVNTTLKPGFNMIANPLTVSDNKVSALLPSVPEGTTIYKWNGVTFDLSQFDFGAWSDPDMLLTIGNGVFVNLPGSVDVTVTFVGDVPTGALSNPIPAGFSIKSSMVPQTAGLDALGFAPPDGTTIYKYNTTTKQYDLDAYDFGAWGTPGGPVIKVGEAFWVSAPSASTWSRTFSVN